MMRRRGITELMRLNSARSAPIAPFNVLPIVEGCVNYGNLSAVCRTSEGPRLVNLPHHCPVPPS